MAEKKIDGVVYRYDKLPATESIPLMLRLMKTIGTAKGIIAAIAAEGSDEERDAAALGAVGEFMTSIDPDEVMSIVNDVIRHCRADGEPAVLGVKPQYLPEALKVLFFALQTEFGSFFGDGLELAGLKQTANRPISALKK